MIMAPLVEITELEHNLKSTVVSLIENGQIQRNFQNDFGILNHFKLTVSLTHKLDDQIIIKPA